MQYLHYFFVPFILSLIFTPIVRKIAIKNGLVSQPRSDRWHKQPTALLGGSGIYCAAIGSSFLLGLVNKSAFGLFFGGTFLFIVGLIDDKFPLSPYIKLFAQIVAGCIAVLFGTTLALSTNISLDIPLTLLWIIGITNSFNLLDNIDGLAAGIAAIASLMLFFSSLILSGNLFGIFALVLAGAVLGFLPYNFNPAKIFMGDSGSMFLGYSLAVISISGTVRSIPNLLMTMLIPVLILGVPIFDTMFVMVVRKLQGRRLFQGGKDHASHHLVTLGLSPKKTVLLLYSISTIFGLIAIVYSRVNMLIISMIGFLALVVLLFFGIFLFDVTTYKNQTEARKLLNKFESSHTVLNSILLFKRRMLEVLLDFIMICIAYYAAYFLRFEGPLLANNLRVMQQSLVWIILIKMSVFFIFGLYRGVWRYMGVSDSLTMLKVVSLGSIGSVLFLTFAFRFQDYSRTVFFIDWLLLLFLITGSRFLIRIIGEFFSRIQEGEKKILIFGAGDTGEMVLREIKRNKSLNYKPVGFVDDDPYKKRNKIHGVSVLGTRKKLKELIRSKGVREVIIAVPSIEQQDFGEIVGICEECDVFYRRVKGILDE